MEEPSETLADGLEIPLNVSDMKLISFKNYLASEHTNKARLV